MNKEKAKRSAMDLLHLFPKKHRQYSDEALRAWYEESNAPLGDRSQETLHYLAKLQQAAFPGPDQLKKIFPESFVLHKPKRIASGDFYWMDFSGHRTYLAVGDCRGKPIAAALLGAIAGNILSKALRDQRNARPSELLLALNYELKKLLKDSPSETEVEKSIAIAIISLDYKNCQLEHSGALGPMYMIRRNTLSRIGCDRFPAGYSLTSHPKEFTNHEMRIQYNDVIYLFTDGYADQFGGPEGKKMGYLQFQQFLLSIHKKEMAGQKQLLEKMFSKWLGNVHSQLDDVLVLGLSI